MQRHELNPQRVAFRQGVNQLSHASHEPVDTENGDHIDEVFNSGWARTLSKGIRDQKGWMSQMQRTYEGPLIAAVREDPDEFTRDGGAMYTRLTGRPLSLEPRAS